MVRIVRVVPLVKLLGSHWGHLGFTSKVVEWHSCCMCSCSRANYTIRLEISVWQNLTNEQVKS